MAFSRVTYNFSHNSQHFAEKWQLCEFVQISGAAVALLTQQTLADIITLKCSKVYESECITQTVYMLHVSAPSTATFREVHYEVQKNQNVTRFFLKPVFRHKRLNLKNNTQFYIYKYIYI